MQYFISVSNTKERCIKINNSVYYESDEQINTISDSNKQVDPRAIQRNKITLSTEFTNYQ